MIQIQIKYLLLILFIAFVFSSVAQPTKPVAVANTYTLSEADGFPGYNYVTSGQFSSTGKIYIKDFFGNLHITGNNFIKKIPGVKNLENNVGLYLLSDTVLWICSDVRKVIYIIANDTLQKTVEFPFKNFYTANNGASNVIYQFKPAGNYIEVYKFITDKWVLLNKAAWDSTIKIDKSENQIFKGNQFFLRTIAAQNKEGIYLFDTVTNQFKYINTIPKINNAFNKVLYNNNWQIIKPLQQLFSDFYTTHIGKWINNNEFKFLDNDIAFRLISPDENSFVLNYQNDLYEYVNFDSTHILPGSFIIETSNKLNHIQKNPNYPYFLALTNNKPMRIFPYIKKYPYLFNQKNSANIFALGQDDNGNIWAGSYQNNLSIISSAPANSSHSPKVKELSGARMKLTELPKQPYRFMNAGINYNHKLYFVGETFQGGILQYNLDGIMHKLKPQTPIGFYLYYAPRSKTIWMPSAEDPNYPVYTCNASELEKPFIHWQKLDTAVGIKPFGFSTMTEDTLQRIWIGHPKKGFAVYNRQTKKAITYDLHKNETPIGFISCVTDAKGTVFMGSDDKGLWYYNDYTKPPTPQNIHNIYHPLLNNTIRITSMAIYNNWLVMGCYNKICLLNLDSFYNKHTTVVRYLNPQEASFTSFTEQNTMLVSKTDSTLWFSTGDMLYQWDIKTWLQLPQYKATVHTFLQNDSDRTELSCNHTLHLDAGITSFDIVFEYLSPDGLPRYTRTALVKQGDSVAFNLPNIASSKFVYKNLSSGKYTFYIEIFEQDGSTSRYEYPFIINKYLWQQWWFWVLASFVFVTPFILWLNSLRKEAIQQKKISQLSIVSLSSQFRPHFILNALNTIGADLRDKPNAETVISRLGESINLIFNQAQQKRIAHTLKNEWVLVENVITIHRIMYIPELQVQEPSKEWLHQNFDIQVPMGIIEIMVENALLHGLRNKKQAPYILQINATADETNIYFAITDNGIGRAKAMQLSNYKKHGTGTKNLSEIIGILNKFNKNKIEINYTDKVFSDEENSGTVISIVIPKNYFYDY